MVSYTHFDALTYPATGRRLAALLNRLEADVVVHCGDLADGSVTQRRSHVDPLGEVSAPLRLYIAGNHEYYSDAAGWRAVMDELGWTVLTNAHVTLDREGHTLVFAGLDDPTGSTYPTGGPDPDAALAGAPDAPVVVLAHQPHQVREVRDRADLVLSGHTHGGQIWPFHLLVLTREPALHGLSRHGSRTQLWVSRGAGFWGPPFRVFAPSDVSCSRCDRPETRLSPPTPQPTSTGRASSTSSNSGVPSIVTVPGTAPMSRPLSVQVADHVVSTSPRGPAPAWRTRARSAPRPPHHRTSAMPDPASPYAATSRPRDARCTTSARCPTPP